MRFEIIYVYEEEFRGQFDIMVMCIPRFLAMVVIILAHRHTTA